MVKLLQGGRIPFERTGRHRHIPLRDLLRYREIRRAGQYAALTATSAGFDEDEDVVETLRQLREARKVVAARRRQRQA